MDDENKSKNFYSQQEISLEEKTLKYKTFNLFYEISKNKQYSLWANSIFIILEMFQLISYAFDEPHKSKWKIKESSIDKLSTILGATRIVALMKFVNITIYIVIFIFLIIVIFGIFLFLLMEILLFTEFQSKLYSKCITITNLIINPLYIFLYIPINELILLPLKCKNGYIDIVKNNVKCYENIYYLYFILGIIGSILLLICGLYLLNFYFFPIQYNPSSLRIYATNDIILLISKFIFIYRYMLIKNDRISIIILLLLNLLLLTNEYNNPTYNNSSLNLICSIRNICVFWTYFLLLISTLLENADDNGFIYMLLFGYPIIVYCFMVLLNRKELNKETINDKFDNLGNYLKKTDYLIQLIDSFLDNNKNVLNNNNLKYQKNEIILKGFIEKHNENCLNPECPLNNFCKNLGNFYVQKQCLLNFMTIYFEKGIKRFPESIYLLIYYIQFNYSKRYNLNIIHKYLTKIKNMGKNLDEEFIIFCIEQNVRTIKNKINDNNDNNELELKKDLIEQKLQRLKYLIENSTKLYGEFWGIFATNITNNINTLKLYTLGEKLNKYLKEINNIWDNDLKSKKIDVSNHGIIQLYSHFLKEILWNKKKSDEITKKINDEHYHHETKKIDEENFNGNNFEEILENQDYIFFCNSNDKGKYTIIQCSNSMTNLLGYEKSEIIGKSIEMLMPSILIDLNINIIQENIKKLNIIQKNQQEFNKGNDNKQISLLPKSKMGFILPYICKLIIYDDKDFSNSYIIKCKLEPKENKTIYPYYILAKNDFTISCISSSCIYLGLSLDLLKKYMIKMNILIRTNDDRTFKIEEKIDELDEKDLEIIWVYPDIIYPKNNIKRQRDEDMDNLIKYSKKQKYMLKIKTFRNNKDEIIALLFRLTDIKMINIKNIKNEYIPKVKKEFLFDILSLHYIRTITVDIKTGNKSLRDKDDNKEKDKNKKNINNSLIKEEKEDNSKEDKYLLDDDENKKKEFILTKEKINELQGENLYHIKNVINNMPFYGRDVQLEKLRPNRERYPVGRIQEPNIKILIANFCVFLEKRQGKNLLNNLDNYNNNNNINNNSRNNISSEKKQSEDLNREFSSDSSSSLSNLFNAKSIIYIKILCFIIFIAIIVFIFLEFYTTYTILNKVVTRIVFLDYGYQLLANMLYIKYFISEAVFSYEIPEKFPQNNIILYYYDNNERIKYVEKLKKELGEYLVLFNSLLNNFNSAPINSFKEYIDFLENLNMPIYTITISDNKERESIINETYSSAMRRIPSNVFYISSNNDPNYVINMKNQNSFELMQNILNSFYMTWKDITNILYNDIKAHCVKGTLSYVLLIGSFLLTFLCIFLIYKLLLIFNNDRKKPINLFLTIKKNIFEELKNASEGFSNKLLNKFFGNEENEEEMQQDYTTNIKENDINIIKFKSSNDNKLSGNTEKTNIFIYMQLIIFLFFCNGYIVAKFLYTFDNIKHLSTFKEIFNINHKAHINIILSVNVVKSFLFNDSIPIFNKKEKKEILYQFLDIFYNQSNSFEETLLETSNLNYYPEYRIKFYEYLYHDYKELVKNNINDTNLIEKYNIFIPVLTKLFENLKYITLKYLNYGYKENREEYENNNEEAKNGYPSELIADKIWIEIDELTTTYIRFWFNNIMVLMMNSLNNYAAENKLIHISLFLVMVVIIIFAYCTVWKNNENKLKIMLNTSFDLVNLIPEKIKYIIISKLNE